MSQLGLTNTVATATSIIGCTWWAGVVQALSILSVPAILQNITEPDQAMRMWRYLFLHGQAMGPKVGLVTFLSLGYSAYERRSQDLKWRPFVVAGTLSLAMVPPYTLIFMSSTNRALLAGAQGVTALKWSETKVLLTRWQTLNFVRGLLPMAGAVLGLEGDVSLGWGRSLKSVV